MQLSADLNRCITDVLGVKVGHVTLYDHINDQDTICTGVTAILPHAGDLFRHKVQAASYIINDYGKTTGLLESSRFPKVVYIPRSPFSLIY